MRLADQLRNGETVFTAWSYIPDPILTEALATTEFGAVTLDMQHGGHDERSVLTSVSGILGQGKSAVVRIPVGRFDMASRALDMGTEAVIAPMINTLDDAKAFAAAMKYPPVGERSWGPGRTLLVHRDEGGTPYLKKANAKTLAFAMIETREAFSITDDILAIDGIDGVFVGPSDFSIAWSNGETLDATLQDMMPAIGDIASKAVASGKIACIYAMNPKLCPTYLKMGYRFIAIGNEHKYLAAGAVDMLNTCKA